MLYDGSLQLIKKKGHKEFLEVLGMFITLIVVMIFSQVYAYVQAQKNVYIKYVRFLYINYTSIELLK